MRIGSVRARREDERGAAGILVGISIIMLFGFGAFAVDAGNLWQERRHVTRATDAASLAAAQEYAVGGDGCGGTDDQYTIANDVDATVESCTPSNLSVGSGFVTVEAQTPVDFLFAGVIGFGDTKVDATTTASYRVAQSVVGLRPFGLCAAIVEEMRVLGGTHRVYFDPETQILEGNPVLNCVDPGEDEDEEEEEVENPPGNWGLIDLDDQKPVGTPDLRDWIRNGYEGAVETEPIGGDTGFRSALSSALADVVGDEFCLPVYTNTDGQGSNATYDISGFVKIRLVDFDWQKSKDAYLEVEIIDPGVCGEGGGEEGSFPVTDFGARTVRICAVDFADDTSNC